jgi:iron complex transport system substrate-binding protein
MRIVSVLPSATEIVYAIGHGAELVARSSECDYPADVARLPAVMRPKTLDSDRSSSEIDERVQATRNRGESLYELDVPLLSRLRPDLLLTQDLCGVCSVTDAEVRAACSVAGVSPNVLALTPHTLDEVWGSVEAVAVAVGDAGAGRALAARLRREAAARSGPGYRPRIAVVEWLDPPILAGLWVPDMVRAGGATAIGPMAGAPGARTTWADLASEDPNLVILSPCSFSTARTRRELGDRALRESIETLDPALGTFLADEAYFSRPGPRLVDGVTLVRNLTNGTLGTPPMSVEPLVDPSGRLTA